MISITTLLVTHNPSVINDVQRLHDDIEYARLEVCGRLEKVPARLGQSNTLLLIHRDPQTDPERVRAVSALADAVARNLQITQSYHELLVALDRHLGFERDLNWCAFATWASKQAGVFIRHDELPAALRRFLRLEGARPRRWTPTGFLLSDRFRAYARMTAEDMSAHLAEGNRLVYTLLAPFFAGLVAHFRDHPAPDPAARDAFLAAIPAEPATGDELRRAFAQHLRHCPEDCLAEILPSWPEVVLHHDLDRPVTSNALNQFEGHPGGEGKGNPGHSE